MPLTRIWLEDRRLRIAAWTAAILAPVLAFYAALLALAINVPMMDDYDALLNFANTLVAQPDRAHRWSFFFASQHNEYKLFLEHAIVWLQLTLTGHIQFAVLSALGNLWVLLLGIVLWKMFLPAAGLERRLALFVPVSLLLFQFQYWETLDWPMAGLQNLPVAVCGIGSLYLIDRRTRISFGLALAMMALGVCASGNGFVVVPLGAAILLRQRRLAQLAAWLGAIALLVSAYAFRYRQVPEAGQVHRSLLGTLLHPHPLFMLGFLGAAGRYPVRAGAVLLGFALCVFWGWMATRGYLRRQPAVSYCLGFILLTAIGVSGLRAGVGFAQSMASRYRLYSDLLLIFAWFALCEEFLADERHSLRRSRLFAWVLAFSILFCVSFDGLGVYLMHRREIVLRDGMTIFQRSEMMQSPVILDNDPQGQLSGFPEHARRILIEAEQRGIYQPDPY